MKFKLLIAVVSFVFWIDVFGLEKQTVSSISEMTALTNVDVVEVVSGTGVDGTFRWDANSTENENNGTIFEPDGGGIGRWKRIFNGRTYRVEWFGTPSATTIEAAINAGAHDIIIPQGESSYNWDKELEITSNITIRTDSATEYSAVFNYTGPEGGTMLKWNEGWGGMSGIHLNGNQRAGIILHLGEDGSAFHLEFNRMHFNNATVAGTIFGNYSENELDADVSFITFNNCRWVGNYRQVVYDSKEALDIVFINPDMTGGTASIDIARHLDMTRGGSATIISGHLGPMGNSGNSSYPIYVKDGWVEIFGLQNESASGGGGLIEMDAPTLSTGTPSELIRIRDWSIGASGTGYKILMHAGANPLCVKSSCFLPRSSISASKMVRLDGTAGALSAAKFLSINNTYHCNTTLPWATGAIDNVTSIGDTITRDGTNFSPIANYINKRIPVSVSPYTLTDGNSFFECEAGSSVFNLLPALTFSGREITIKNKKPSGPISVVPSGNDTINGSAATMTLYVNDSVTLVCDGYSNWLVKSWASGITTTQLSTGTGIIKTGTANNSNNAGWLQVAPGKFIPYWTNPNP